MDWANQPDPFRRYAGAELLPLPLMTGPRHVDFATLDRTGFLAPTPLNAQSLSLFLELSMGLTAWKSYQGTSWALRANASSGNLHPTGLTLVAPAVPGVNDKSAVYNYAPREHGLETLQTPGPGGSLTTVLSSVHWREAWKYGERAYRYCQLDAGHALGAITYAATLMGWQAELLAEPGDKALAVLAGFEAREFVHGEGEVADFALSINTGGGGGRAPEASSGAWLGSPNRLGRQHLRWNGIELVDAAAAKPPTVAPTALKSAGTNAERAGTNAERVSFGIGAVDLVRGRRSAVAMDGRTGISRDAFLGMLARAMPAEGFQPWDALPHGPSLSLAVFVHRVEGLVPGLYLLARGSDHGPRLRAACDGDFAWNNIGGLPFYLLREGDYRDTARAISCGQDIAADGAFSLSMISDFEATLSADGPWAYRRMHWEAGVIGQLLYLEAEAAGLRATGIGCFFDLETREVLGIKGEDWQSLYHFTVGAAVEDDRLQTLDAYHHLPKERRC